MSGAQGRLNDAQGRLNGAQSRWSGAQGRVSGAQGRANGAQGRVSGAQSRASGAQSRVSGAQGRVFSGNYSRFGADRSSGDLLFFQDHGLVSGEKAALLSQFSQADDAERQNGGEEYDVFLF